MAKKRSTKRTTKRSTRRRSTRSTPKDLQATIKAQGFSWEASSEPATPYSLGLKFDNAELKQLEAAIASANSVELMAASFSAPAAVDWRNNNGNWVTPVKNQRSCGSCVSFATCATLESRIKIVCKNASMNPDLSESHLFFCGCGNCCDNGWQFTPALDYAKNTGVGVEADFPYTPNNQPCRDNINPYIKIDSWRRVLSTTERKQVIAERGPVVAGMKVYSDFQSYSSGIYRRTSGASFQGNHAVVVAGYSDSEQCWIVKNSWGRGWGENGFVRIGYGEVGLDTTYPFYDVSLQCPVQPVQDVCRRYVPFLRQVLIEARRNPRLRACLRYYVCRIGSRPNCGPREIRIVRHVITILRRCRQYHRPFCRALG